MSQDLTVQTKVRCVVCELEFKREESLAHQYSQGIDPNAIAPGICVEHQTSIDNGFIHVVEIQRPDSADLDYDPQKPTYTGRRAAIQKAMFDKMYPGAQAYPVHYMHPDAFEKIMKFEHKIRKTKNKKLH